MYSRYIEILNNNNNETILKFNESEGFQRIVKPKCNLTSRTTKIRNSTIGISDFVMKINEYELNQLVFNITEY